MVFVTCTFTVTPIRAMAIELAVNAKTHRYGTCNTMESLLIDSDVKSLLP
jgi:glutamate-5-semialdehyde dehydrogenase